MSFGYWLICSGDVSREQFFLTPGEAKGHHRNGCHNRQAQELRKAMSKPNITVFKRRTSPGEGHWFDVEWRLGFADIPIEAHWEAKEDKWEVLDGDGHPIGINSRLWSDVVAACAKAVSQQQGRF